MTDRNVTTEVLLMELQKAIAQEYPPEVVERLQWFLHFLQHGSVSATCRHFGIARTTFYRWWKRYDPQNLSTLMDLPTTERAQEAAQNKTLFLLPPLTEHRTPVWLRKLRFFLIVVFLINAGVFLAILPASAASSWNPTLLVNTEAFQVIDDADTASDVYIQFGETLQKTITYERTSGRFNFNDDVNIQGTASGTHLHSEDMLSASGSVKIQPAADSTTAVLVLDADGGDPVLNIDTTNERVGIGTGSIAATLDVDGSIYFTGGSGDVNGDGDILTDDVLLLRNYINGSTTLTKEQYARADVTGDGIVNYSDFAVIYASQFGTVTNAKRSEAETVFGVSSLGVAGTYGDEQSYLRGKLGIATASPGSPLSVSGSVVIGENVGSKTADAGLLLEVHGAASGRVLHAQDLLTTSGALIVEEGKKTWFNGIDYLYPYVEGASGTVLKTDGNGVLTWSTDGGGGLTEESADDRYVRVAGDTMTGALLITEGGEDTWAPETTLEVKGTMSGGRLSVTTSEVVGTGAVYINNDGAGTGILLDSESLAHPGEAIDMVEMQYDGGNRALNPHLLFGYNGTFDVNLYRKSAHLLYTDDSFYVRQTLSGAYVNASSTFEGAGLTNCDPVTSKLVWNSSTKRFSCVTDQTSAGESTTTLQQAYDNDANGGDATIATNSTDDSVRIDNPSSNGTDSDYVFEVENDAAAKIAILLDQNGTGTGMLLDSESLAHPGEAIDMPVITYGNGKALNPHLLFGYNGIFDVNLYRSAADYLKTDDNLIVGGAGNTITLNTVEYTFPAVDGSSGTVLKTDGNGVLTWSTDGGGG
ncbi:hypothetical protein COU80_05395, partial [Candidatus Peregrinibacteria bacterium CG10_big_fil_rev_8_21_14_0_10_55_24]